jgi:protein CLEC16A
MFTHFTRIMRQKCGSYVTVQLLQTLNIMIENVRHETSLCMCARAHANIVADFLLSNNYVNDIISHPFDFTNEEVRAIGVCLLCNCADYGLLHFVSQDAFVQIEHEHDSFFLQ